MRKKSYGVAMKEILFNTCVFANDKVWFMSNNRNFMCMDVRTNKISFVMAKDLNKINFKVVVDSMLFDGTDIYWIEYDAGHLVKYSIWENRCEFFRMPSIERRGGESVVDIVLYNKKVYIFPQYAPCLIVFDIADKTFSIRNKLYHTDQDKMLEKKEESWWRLIRMDSMIFLFNIYDNTLVKYHLDKENFEIASWPKVVEKPIYMLWKENIFYILSSDNSIYSWDGYSYEAKKIYSSKGSVAPFYRMSATKSKLFLLPSRADTVGAINLKSLEFEYINNYPDDFKYNEKTWSRYYGSCESERYIWYANRSANYILRLDKKNDLAEWVKPEVPSLKEESEYYAKIGKTMFQEQETDIRILFEDMGKKQDSTVKTTIGSDIWRKLGGANINEK